METFDSRFGSLAPPAPAPKTIPAVPLELEDLVKVEGGSDGKEPGDPVGAVVERAKFEQEVAKSAGTVINFGWGAIVGVADDSGELEKSAPVHADGIEIETYDDGQIWKFHYAGGRLIKSELTDPQLGHMTFDEQGNEVAA